MNSRQTRCFKSYGLTVNQAKAQLKDESGKSSVGFAEYMLYCPKDLKHANILARAKATYNWGKHLGSKPYKVIIPRLTSTERRIARYAQAFNIMKKIDERQKETANNNDN